MCWNGNSRWCLSPRQPVSCWFLSPSRRAGMICTMNRSASDPGGRTVVLQSCHVWHESTRIRGRKVEWDMSCSGDGRLEHFAILCPLAVECLSAAPGRIMMLQKGSSPSTRGARKHTRFCAQPARPTGCGGCVEGKEWAQANELLASRPTCAGLEATRSSTKHECLERLDEHCHPRPPAHQLNLCPRLRIVCLFAFVVPGRYLTTYLPR